jgi:hypothetical protein
MSADRIDPTVASVDSLLASERVVVAEPQEVRRRAFARARAAMSGQPVMPISRVSRRWFGGMRFTVAAALALVVASAAALGVKRTFVKRIVPESPVARESSVTPPRESPPPLPPVQAPAGSDAPAPARGPLSSPPSAPPRSTTVAESYALELKVLQPARVAAARGDFAVTLAAVVEHERRFPNGQLVEEREALRVRALTGEQRFEEARRAAASFRRRFPGSVLLTRMKEAGPTP